MLDIIGGKRPPKPALSKTRGYTEELWKMTTLCWREKPAERPTVEDMLGGLEAAAKQWNLKHGGLSTLSPPDGWRSSLRKTRFTRFPRFGV